MQKNLSDLMEGQSARVTGLLTADSMRRRLWDLGFVEGTRVCCAGRGARGGMIAYRVRGAVIALRDEDAKRVLVC